MKKVWLAAITLATATAAQAQTNPHFYPHATGPVMGQAGPAAGAYAAPQRPDLLDFVAASPDQILRSGINRLEGFLSRGEASPEETQAFLEKEISPYFDFDYMARWAGGALYAQMDEEQKANFAGKLQGMFFAALARNLGAYAQPKPQVDVFPARSRGYGNEVVVTARVTPQTRGAYPVRLEFRFYPSRSGWKIFDATANGTSAVNYYRTFFNEVARRGSIEACCR